MSQGCPHLTGVPAGPHSRAKSGRRVQGCGRKEDKHPLAWGRGPGGGARHKGLRYGAGVRWRAACPGHGGRREHPGRESRGWAARLAGVILTGRGSPPSGTPSARRQPTCHRGDASTVTSPARASLGGGNALLRRRRGHAVPMRGTWLSPPHRRCHHRDDARGTLPRLQEGEAWSGGPPYAWKHLGGVAFQGEALGPDSLGACPRDPPQDPTGCGVRTILKSRWSLVYCHMLPRRLAAALEDFSLSELGQGQHAMSPGYRWARDGAHQAKDATPEGPRGAEDLALVGRGRRLKAGAHCDEQGAQHFWQER